MHYIHFYLRSGVGHKCPVKRREVWHYLWCKSRWSEEFSCFENKFPETMSNKLSRRMGKTPSCIFQGSSFTQNHLRLGLRRWKSTSRNVARPVQHDCKKPLETDRSERKWATCSADYSEKLSAHMSSTIIELACFHKGEIPNIRNLLKKTKCCKYIFVADKH